MIARSDQRSFALFRENPRPKIVGRSERDGTPDGATNVLNCPTNDLAWRPHACQHSDLTTLFEVCICACLVRLHLQSLRS